MRALLLIALVAALLLAVSARPLDRMSTKLNAGDVMVETESQLAVRRHRSLCRNIVAYYDSLGGPARAAAPFPDFFNAWYTQWKALKVHQRDFIMHKHGKLGGSLILRAVLTAKHMGVANNDICTQNALHLAIKATNNLANAKLPGWTVGTEWELHNVLVLPNQPDMNAVCYLAKSGKNPSYRLPYLMWAIDHDTNGAVTSVPEMVFGPMIVSHTAAADEALGRSILTTSAVVKSFITQANVFDAPVTLPNARTAFNTAVNGDREEFEVALVSGNTAPCSDNNLVTMKKRTADANAYGNPSLQVNHAVGVACLASNVFVDANAVGNVVAYGPQRSFADASRHVARAYIHADAILHAAVTNANIAAAVKGDLLGLFTHACGYYMYRALESAAERFVPDGNGQLAQALAKGAYIKGLGFPADLAQSTSKNFFSYLNKARLGHAVQHASPEVQDILRRWHAAMVPGTFHTTIVTELTRLHGHGASPAAGVENKRSQTQIREVG